MNYFELPARALLAQQAAWLAPLRGRLLRRSHIARRRRVLDLGAGWGHVTAELAERAALGALTVGLDLALEPLQHPANSAIHAKRVNGDATALPFASGAFDLVFCQFALLWMPLAPTLDEITRVLAHGGVLLALEPDYGGLIEHPPALATRDLWLAALRRAGADPLLGRQLPGALAERGFALRLDLIPELSPPAPERFAFLRELPLTALERATLEHIEAEAATLTTPWHQIAHLPLCLVTATKGAPCD